MWKISVLIVSLLYCLNFAAGTIPVATFLENQIIGRRAQSLLSGNDHQNSLNEMLELFDNTEEMTIEKLPMLYVVMFNDLARGLLMNLDEYFVFVKWAVHLKKIKERSGFMPSSALMGFFESMTQRGGPQITIDYVGDKHSFMAPLIHETTKTVKFFEAVERLDQTKNFYEKLPIIRDVCAIASTKLPDN